VGKDFYSVLDVDPGIDKEEIRKAYVQLARQYHPDMNKDPDARDRFEEIQQAYMILSDDEARVFYNLYYEGAQEASQLIEPRTWWQQYGSVVEVSIWGFGTLVWIGLFILLGVAAYSFISYIFAS
jgi:DnaJ-class molecular chaperone